MSLETVEIPQAIYGCKTLPCAEETSYPPEMLRYLDDTANDEYPPGFYCEFCIDDAMLGYYGPGRSDDPECKIGPTLAAVIAERAGDA